MPRGMYERKPWMRNNMGAPILCQDAKGGIVKDRLTMSISEVAEKWGVSRATVTHVEAGDWGNQRRRKTV